MLELQTKEEEKLNTCSGKNGDFDPHGTVIGAYDMEQRTIRDVEKRNKCGALEGLFQISVDGDPSYCVPPPLCGFRDSAPCGLSSARSL
jgi:hypothetical protein